jgi:hypothetical protein
VPPRAEKRPPPPPGAPGSVALRALFCSRPRVTFAPLRPPAASSAGARRAPSRPEQPQQLRKKAVWPNEGFGSTKPRRWDRIAASVNAQLKPNSPLGKKLTLARSRRRKRSLTTRRHWRNRIVRGRLASGQSVYAYVDGDPVRYADPLGLRSRTSNTRTTIPPVPSRAHDPVDYFRDPTREKREIFEQISELIRPTDFTAEWTFRELMTPKRECAVICRNQSPRQPMACGPDWGNPPYDVPSGPSVTAPGSDVCRLLCK